MKIARNNYEEYFILYMDGELSVEERKEVEEFVALHPDLKDELDLLQQFRLEPDPGIVFSGKEELMKMNGETPVTLSNREEWFSQYTDNELNSSQKKMVEDFIAAHPDTARDLLLFERTRLQPETIHFPHKASLYRREKERRLIPLRWWKVAVAAVLVVGVGLATYSLLDKKSSAAENNMAGTDVPRKEKADPLVSPAETKTPPVELVAKEAGTDQNHKGNDDRQLTLEEPAIRNAKQDVARTVETPAEQKPDAPLVAVDKTNNLPKPEYNPNINNQQAPAPVIASVEPRQKQNLPDALTNPVVTNTSPHSPDIATASRKETIEQPDGKKNKLRGFFRKITRTFDKRTNADEANENNDLLVAGLSIKLR